MGLKYLDCSVYSSYFQQLDQLTREVKLIDEDMKRVMVSGTLAIFAIQNIPGQ